MKSNSHAYAGDYQIIARKGHVHFYNINAVEIFREKQQNHLRLRSKAEKC